MRHKCYEKANTTLQHFIDNHILNYEKVRNYDFGVDNRDNVSNLSMFISHRIITEYQIIHKVLKKYKLNQVEKYVQEVFWRVYWKGWLENRPKVWSDFVNDCSSIQPNLGYEKAINGNTNINCFNEWVNELEKYNYLHNHTRMWFASIWIFTLKLPWQLGAKFFYEHLFDGDSASNTLSWRWVAGLQTKGKNYLAKSWNIQKFTNNRFHEENLNEFAEPIEDFREYKVQENFVEKISSKKNSDLIIFENDLFIKDRYELFNSYKNIYLLLLNNKKRQLPLSRKVYNFKKSLCYDFANEISNCHFIDAVNESFFENLKNIDAIYPFVGENLDFLKKVSMEKSIKLNFIHREEDEYCRQFSKKGFFNFKSNIQNIIDFLGLGN